MPMKIKEFPDYYDGVITIPLSWDEHCGAG